VTADSRDAPPLIGITSHRARAQFGFWDRDFDLLATTFVDAVMEAGGQAVMLPARSRLNGSVLHRLDGLILSGGPDIDAGLYGEERHERSETPEPERDAAELTALAAAQHFGLPVLAVCRGAQMLNVWRGGSLEQHLPDLGRHEDHGTGGEFASNAISVAAGSWLESIVGRSTTGSCHHHQAVKDVGDGLVPVAFSHDGVIEALELQGEIPVIGVQWHPEEIADDRVIPGFVEAVDRERRKRSYVG
jgi:gamma-glutamyl-gamma-aminobutyrate hydrolase PuuD